MVYTVESIIYYLVLIDAIGANVVSWLFAKWYKKNMHKGIVKHLPATKGWAVVYLGLVLWVGYGLLRLGII
ncbi:hypothetical protein CMI46_00520 [Candidatus Pacearchaeota archaeon]|nr:hypothetical protein [Candidatus Pacearchaeota archaeon]|tara:strand:+ start:4748 stop:4960 length:213 start_codon:yes stop_codon:yes gene_type:complete